MNLTADTVDELVRDSVFLDEEMVDLDENGAPPDAIIVEGVVNTYAFHPVRLESHRNDLIAMIGDLPIEFLPADQGGGGGWSFLNLCMTKDNVQWTSFHLVQERFMCMCAGLGMAKIIPREMWQFLPGNVPYVTFDPTGVLPR